MSSANTIVLKSQSGEGQHDEKVAVAIVSPGMLLETDSAGKVKAHATASGPHQRLFAKEDALQGKTRTQDYAIGDPVSIHVGLPGDVLDLVLKDGQVIVIGDPVTSNADGKLKKYAAPTLAGDDFHIIGYAEEALSPSGADGFLSTRLV